MLDRRLTACTLLVVAAALPRPVSADGPVPPRARRTMANPLPGGRVTSPYGLRLDPLTGEGDHHDGVDVTAAVGAKVLATWPGVVLTAELEDPEAPELGSILLLSHADGFATFYAHLGAVVVAVGDEVRPTQLVGRIGATDDAGGPHVHVEIRKDGKPVDPRRFVAAWRSRHAAESLEAP